MNVKRATNLNDLTLGEVNHALEQLPDDRVLFYKARRKAGNAFRIVLSVVIIILSIILTSVFGYLVLPDSLRFAGTAFTALGFLGGVIIIMRMSFFFTARLNRQIVSEYQQMLLLGEEVDSPEAPSGSPVSF